MNTLRDYNKLYKIISNDNGRKFFEMVRENKDLYMFFSFDKLCIWHNGLNVCTVGEKGIHSMTQSFKERAEKCKKIELIKEIETAQLKDKFSVYLKYIKDIMGIVKSGSGKQVERKNQQIIAQNNSNLRNFHILDLEFAIPEKIAVSSKPEFDYLAVDTSKKIIYLIEYKCTYNATCNGPSNLKKHYDDMKEIKEHKELIMNTVENLWHLEKEEVKSFSDYKILPAFLFTDFHKFTHGQNGKINGILNQLKKDDSEIVVWNFDEPNDVDFSEEPTSIEKFNI